VQNKFAPDSQGLRGSEKGSEIMYYSQSIQALPIWTLLWFFFF